MHRIASVIIHRIVEGNFLLAIVGGNILAGGVNSGVAGHADGIFSIFLAEFCVIDNFVRSNRIGRALLIVVHRIASVVLFLPLRRQNHIRSGHGKLAVLKSWLIHLGRGNFPARELIAIARRHTVRHNNVSVLRVVQAITRNGACTVIKIINNLVSRDRCRLARRHDLGLGSGSIFRLHLYLYSGSRGFSRVVVGWDIFTGATLAAGLHLNLNDQLFRIGALRMMRREIIIRDRHGLAVGGSHRFGCVLTLLLIAVRIDRVDLHVFLSTGKGEVVGQRVGDHGLLVQLIIDRLGNLIGDYLENIIQIGSVNCRLIVALICCTISVLINSPAIAFDEGIPWIISALCNSNLACIIGIARQVIQESVARGNVDRRKVVTAKQVCHPRTAPITSRFSITRDIRISSIIPFIAVQLVRVRSIEDTNGINGDVVILHVLRRRNSVIGNIGIEIALCRWHAVGKDDHRLLTICVVADIGIIHQVLCHLHACPDVRCALGFLRQTANLAGERSFTLLVHGSPAYQRIRISAKGHDRHAVVSFRAVLGCHLADKAVDRVLHRALACAIIEIICHRAGLVQHQHDIHRLDLGRCRGRARCLRGHPNGVVSIIRLIRREFLRKDHAGAAVRLRNVLRQNVQRQ